MGGLTHTREIEGPRRKKGDTLAKRGKRRRTQREQKKGKCILTKEMNMLDNN